MKWQYKASLFLLLFSQTLFFLFVFLQLDSNVYGSSNPDVMPTVGYSWIWYHKEYWMICFVLNIFALLTFIHGWLEENNWKLSSLIEIEVNKEEEDEES